LLKALSAGERPPRFVSLEPMEMLMKIIATTVDDEIIRFRDLRHATSVLVTHQIRDAFYVATHQAVRNAAGRIVPRDSKTVPQVEFMILHGGRIHCHGTADELLASEDPYVKRFLFNTLPPW